MRRDIPKSYLGKAARKQKRIRLVVKRWRSRGVLCVALRHEHDQALPRTRERGAIRVQERFRSAAGIGPFPDCPVVGKIYVEIPLR